jgi:hypothetical protein
VNSATIYRTRLLQLVLCSVLASGFTAAQVLTSSTPEQEQTTAGKKGSEQRTKKSALIQVDPTPVEVMPNSTAVESSPPSVIGPAMSVDRKSGKETRRGEIVVAPFPISNPAIGSGLVVVGGYLFPLSKRDAESPDSMLGGGSFYTSNGSWLWGAGGKLYFKRDRFRVTGAYGHAQLHYDLYGIGNSAGNLGLSVPINQGGTALLLEFLTRVKGKLFVGPRYQRRALDAHFTAENFPPGFNIDPVELKSATSSLGLHIQHDLRDSQFYPTKGTLTDIVGDFFQGTFGGDFNYQSYTFAFNKFSSISPRQVFAFRVFGCATTGHVPFYDLCMLGMHNDIRGYKTGRYRDKLMLTTQAEYRLELPKRFGLAAFFGVGEVAPELGAFNNHDLKPAGGAGIRYTLAKKNHVNLRVDYAAGLQGGGVYMGVSEAF